MLRVELTVLTRARDGLLTYLRWARRAPAYGRRRGTTRFPTVT